MSSLVLLVEDDEDIRDTLSGVLEARGFRVLTARNGRHALDQLQVREVRPGMILLDLMMPVMDGETFLTLQATEPLLAGVPVIIMTAQLSIPDPLPVSVRAVFTKPVQLPDLIEAIRKALASGASIATTCLARGTGSLPEPPPGTPEILPEEITPSPEAVSVLAVAEATRPGSDPGETA